ncbi:hypothetical protein [Pseudoalteromonas sp. SR41-4]|uniref:hypothetical protein n=1 Tax=Pseudoalteromonas sp. SR41-4 TaxID=2760950 RepID=UPI001603D815|nr:hypothetical protein [Pseudoalteromonas sp. SR41-4]MBB1292185.1 hypothetical protein [Pseudoalteromonas sp. SR41-4]
MASEFQVEVWLLICLLIAGALFFLYVFWRLGYVLGMFLGAFIFKRFFKDGDNERAI